MNPIPLEPIQKHNRMIDAFCQDLMNGDYHAPRARIVREIARQSKDLGGIPCPTSLRSPEPSFTVSSHSGDGQGRKGESK